MLQMDESGYLPDLQQVVDPKRSSAASPNVAGLGSNGDEPQLDRYTRLPSASTPTSRSAISLNLNRSRQSLSDLGNLNRSRLSLSSDLGDYAASESSMTASSYLSDMSSRTRYEAESPDELALVRAASTYGCRLMKRSPDRVLVWLPGKEQKTILIS